MPTIDEAKENLMKMTVRDLREMVVKLGMKEEDAENFETKKPLIATIHALRTKIVVEVELPGQEKKDKKQYMSKKEIMRVHLMKQPKVRILIPISEGSEEKPGVIEWEYNERTKRKEQKYISGAYHHVQLNGFIWLVAKGVYQDVPQQIADEVSKSLHQTSQAGRAFLIDRNDPEGGKVRDKLE